MKRFLRRHRGLYDVFMGQWFSVTNMSEEIAAEERLGRLFIEDLRFPSVGNMRRGNDTNAFAAEVKHLILRQRSRRPVGRG